MDIELNFKMGRFQKGIIITQEKKTDLPDFDMALCLHTTAVDRKHKTISPDNGEECLYNECKWRISVE